MGGDQQLVLIRKDAKKFIKNYYKRQQQSPEHLHKLYREYSTLDRPEKDGSTSTTTTVKSINKKIAALKYGDFRADIKSVDAQKSNNGVHVLVTGNLTGKDSTVRNFTQAFFLVPQDNDYFILNDIFQYVDNVPAEPVCAPPASAHAPPPPAPAAAEDDNHGQLEAAPSNNDTRNLSNTSQSRKSQKLTGIRKTELESEIKKCLFHMDRPANAVQKHHNITWRSEVKKMEQPRLNKGKAVMYKEAPQRLQDSRKSDHDKGRTQSKIGPDQHQMSSLDRFAEANKHIPNILTIDLHNQSGEEAIGLLKSHLLFGSRVGSVLFFKVITGQGKHSDGKPVVKPKVLEFLRKEGIKHKEEEKNRGALLIEITRSMTFSFQDEPRSSSSCST